MLSTDTRQFLRAALAKMTSPVRLVFFTQAGGCEGCAAARDLVRELASLTDRLAGRGGSLHGLRGRGDWITAHTENAEILKVFSVASACSVVHALCPRSPGDLRHGLLAVEEHDLLLDRRQKRSSSEACYVIFEDVRM